MPKQTTKFKALYSNHKVSIYGYVLRRADSSEDAADIVAETFLVAWRKIETLPPKNQVRYWLYGVARKVLANHYRSSRRRTSLTKKLTNEFSQFDYAFENSYVEQLLVSSALDSVGDDDLEILRLSVWEGLSSSEIGHVLHMNPATVRSRLHRSKKVLATKLSDAQQNDGYGHSQNNGQNVYSNSWSSDNER